MSPKHLVKFAMAGLAGALVLSFQACSGVGASNGSSSSSSEKSGGGTTTDNPKATLNLMVAASISTSGMNAQLCLDEVRFGTQQASENPFNSIAIPDEIRAMMAAHPVEFNAAMQAFTDSLMGMSLTVQQQPTLVKSITMTEDGFTNIALTVKGECSFGSLSIPTASGPLQVTDTQVLNFKGKLDIRSGIAVLNLDPILQALAGAQTAADVKRVLASVQGTF